LTHQIRANDTLEISSGICDAFCRHPLNFCCFSYESQQWFSDGAVPARVAQIPHRNLHLEYSP